MKTLLLCGLVLLAGPVWGEPPLELLQATYFGTAGDDDIQGGAVAPDGAIYVVGNTGESMRSLPGGVKPARLGENAAHARCGHGFVARLSADGSKVLAYAEFGEGIAMLTTVQVNVQGVYVAGYATERLAPLLAKLPGLIREYPLQEAVRKLEEAQQMQPAKADLIPEKANGQLGRFGAPFVARLSADLREIECGTYLEGWQQAWEKRRCISTKPQWQTWPAEYTWQPTHVAMLQSRDVIVCHDGGYFRDLTEKDRKMAAALDNPDASKKLLERLTFYDVCDYFSRLSGDLSRRVYRKDIYTPAIDLETIKRLKGGWPYPHYSNPRTHRMRLDKDDNAYICGWSASATSQESWWSPYLWKMNTADGSVIRKIRETDPMSGVGNRMGGSVADAAITTFALENDGNMVYSRISDGGYMGLIHFSGSLRRMDLNTLQDRESARTIPCVWTWDLATLPQQHLLALGRYNFKADWTADAWQKGDPTENPGAWLRVYGPKLELRFSTAIQGVLPFAIVPLSAERFLIVGQSKGVLDRAQQQDDKTYRVTHEPNPGVALTKNALFDKPLGNSDGYWMIVRWKGPTTAPDARP